MTAMKCECQREGKLQAGWAGAFDPDLELPFVDHQPGECQCQNALRQYACGDGVIRLLCSCCCTLRDRPVKDN